MRTANGFEVAAPVPPDIAPGAAVHVAVRPERASLTREKPAQGLALAGAVRQVFYLGAMREFGLELAGGDRGVVEMPNDGAAPRFAAGDAVWLGASFDDCRVLPARA